MQFGFRNDSTSSFAFVSTSILIFSGTFGLGGLGERKVQTFCLFLMGIISDLNSAAFQSSLFVTIVLSQVVTEEGTMLTDNQIFSINFLISDLISDTSFFAASPVRSTSLSTLAIILFISFFTSIDFTAL